MAFEVIRQAMEHSFSEGLLVNMTMDSDSSETDRDTGHKMVVNHVVQIIQECMKLNFLAQHHRRERLSSNMTAMIHWCESKFNRWFSQYYYAQWMNSTEFRAFTTVESFLHPSLIALSAVATFLALGVFWRIVSSQKRAAWYFLFTVNNCILLKVLLDPIPRYAAKRFQIMDIYHTLLGCKLLTFLSNVFQFAPNWILLVALIDQVTALRMTRNPTRPQSGSGQTNRQSTLSFFAAKATVICILVGLGVINVHTLWLYSTKQMNSGNGGGRAGAPGRVDTRGNYTTHNYTSFLLNNTAGDRTADAKTTQSPLARCIVVPSDDPSPGIFNYGYPIFLITMHSVVPQLALLAVFVNHIIICCCCTGQSSVDSGPTSDESRVVAVCAALHLLCDIPATVAWFYLTEGSYKDRTYQMFKTRYTINFIIKLWIFIKYVLFVPVVFITSPTFRHQVWTLIRTGVRASFCCGSSTCRRQIALNGSCVGKQLQCVCECTWPRCRQQTVQLCAHQCLCLQCRWPSLNSFDYTRGCMTQRKSPVRSTPTSAHASIEDPPEKHENQKPVSFMTAHLALPMLCECACFQTEEKSDLTGVEDGDPQKIRLKEHPIIWEEIGATEMVSGKTKPNSSSNDEQKADVYACDSF